MRFAGVPVSVQQDRAESGLLCADHIGCRVVADHEAVLCRLVDSLTGGFENTWVRFAESQGSGGDHW